MKNKFEIDQKVWQYDPDDGEKVFGIVTDTTADKIMIKWDDLSQPTEHEKSEWSSIHIIYK